MTLSPRLKIQLWLTPVAILAIPLTFILVSPPVVALALTLGWLGAIVASVRRHQYLKALGLAVTLCYVMYYLIPIVIFLTGFLWEFFLKPMVHWAA